MQYTHKLELSDSEIIALEDAIEVYKNFIKDKIGDKIEAPYWARLQSINQIEKKITSNYSNLKKIDIVEIMKNQQTIFELFFDGACLPKNPGGHIGYGFWITQNREPIIDGSDYDVSNPKNSNNVAEYKGLLLGLNALLDYIDKNKIENYKVNVFGDSTLVINQCNFRWRIKDGMYAETARKVIPLLKSFEKISFKWIPREENDKADQMSRRALIENGFI